MTAHEITIGYLQEFVAAGRLAELDAMTPAALNRASRKTLIAYANRYCLPTFECIEAQELLDMPVADLRFSIVVVDLDIMADRMADAKNSAF